MHTPSRLLAAAVFTAITLCAAVPEAQAAASRTPADGSGFDDSLECHKYPTFGRYRLHAGSARLFARPSTSATVVGIAYPRHHLKVTKARRGWVRVQDRTTGVWGWASTRLVYRARELCLD